MYSGQVHTMDLDITDEQWELWNSENPPHVQNVFPNLTADEREFILTGTTPQEWDKLFPPDDEEDMPTANTLYDSEWANLSDTTKL